MQKVITFIKSYIKREKNLYSHIARILQITQVHHLIIYVYPGFEIIYLSTGFNKIYIDKMEGVIKLKGAPILCFSGIRDLVLPILSF